MKTPATSYGFVPVDEFIRAKDHEETFPYTDTTEFEGTNESYKKLKRIFPVVYVLLKLEGKDVKAVIDGWKYVLFAKANGISEIYACHLQIDDDRDIFSAMVQLQQTNHHSCYSLAHMIDKVLDKHWLGQGHRSDLEEKELDEPILTPDGRKLSIYQRIGLELNISGDKVKKIRKIKKVNSLHLERIDAGKFSLSQAYVKCLEEERGEMPDVPSVKAPTYHTTSTATPTFSEPTSTSDFTATEKAETTTNSEQPAADEVTETSAPALTVIEVRCPHCQENFKITHKSNSK